MEKEHPKFSYIAPDPSKEEWGFLRESINSKSINKLDEATFLHRNGLDEYLKVIFPNNTFIHDSLIPGVTKDRSDYRCEELKLIVEFDGLLHYTSPVSILSDEEHSKFYKEKRYKIARIPYFIQLANKEVKQLFDVDVKEPFFNVNFPFLNDGVTPAYSCIEGNKRMAKEFAMFLEQYEVNIKFLESWNEQDSRNNGVLIFKRNI